MNADPNIVFLRQSQDRRDDVTARPPTWTYVGRARALATGRVLPAVVDGQRIVVFRGRDGAPTALSARCAHMGADLSTGACRNGTLRCPFHAWVYDADGVCIEGTRAAATDGGPRVRRFAVVERMGALFVFVPTGAREPEDAPPEAAPPFPFADFIDGRVDGSLDTLAFAAPVTLPIAAPWFWVAANGFDLRHFDVVHGRRPLTEPEMLREDDDTRTAHYRFEIAGRSFADRIVRRLFGSRSTLTFSTWRGAVLATDAQFGRSLRSRVLFFVTPTSSSTCTVNIFAIDRVGSGPFAHLASRIRLLVKRAMIWSFFREEVATLRHLGRAPARFSDEDDFLARYFAWLRVASGSTRAVPQQTSEATSSFERASESRGAEA